MDDCLQWGYAGDPTRIATYSNIDGELFNGQSLDEQLCIWTNNNSTRIGCSPYKWENVGQVLTYSPAADWRRGTWIWTRLWVSNSLITTYKDYFS